MIYEDEKCIAFNDRYPCAKKHFLIVAKSTSMIHLSKSDAERDQALIGHMMVVAAKVAKQEKLDEGYRVVVNNTKFQAIPNFYIHVIGG